MSLPIFAQTDISNKTIHTGKKEQVVYVTKTGTKYHGTNCGYLHSSKIKSTLTAATKSGLTACSRCKGSPSYIPKTSSSSSSTSTSSSQCSGTTQKGNRCKRMTKSSSGRCYQH
jgi:hypothetical protein